MLQRNEIEIRILGIDKQECSCEEPSTHLPDSHERKQDSHPELASVSFWAECCHFDLEQVEEQETVFDDLVLVLRPGSEARFLPEEQYGVENADTSWMGVLLVDCL